MKHVDATEVRRNFVDVADRVRLKGERLIVDRNGRPLVAIVSVEDAARLDALPPAMMSPPLDRAAIDRLISRAAALPMIDPRRAEEILGYGNDGLAR